MFVNHQWAQETKTVRFKVSAKKKDGTSKGFTSDPYTVKPSPKPELKWGGAVDGGRAKVGSPILKVEYGNNVPFDKSKGKFSVKNYIITIAGMKGELAGGGGKIKGNHLSILKRHLKVVILLFQLNILERVMVV